MPTAWPTTFVSLFIAALGAPAAAAAGDEACPSASPPQGTWDDVLAASAAYAPGRDLYRIAASPIDGRGVFAAGPVPAGTRLSLQWFDFRANDDGDALNALRRDGLRHEEGYLPSGSDVPGAARTTTVAEARRWCAAAPTTCVGITFRHDDPEAGGGETWVSFKNAYRGTLRDESAGEAWHAWVAPHAEERRIAYFPLTCGAPAFPRRLPRDLDPKGLLACVARLLNHKCDATLDVVPEGTPGDFVVPGLPHTRGRDVKVRPPPRRAPWPRTRMSSHRARRSRWPTVPVRPGTLWRDATWARARSSR